MSLIALAASVFIPQTVLPWDRAQSALQAAHGVSARMTFTVGKETPAKGSFVFRQPDLLKIRLASDKVDFEYRQSPKASVYFDHRSRSYQWFPWYAQPFPPPTTGTMLQLCFPQYYALGNLKVLGPRENWSAPRQETVSGVETDVIDSKAPDGQHMTLWIDRFGRILRHRTTFERQGGSMEVTSDFSEVVFGPVDDKVFDIDLPDGYEPENAPRINDTAVVGQRVKLTKGYRLPEEVPEDLGKLGSLVPVMILVTSEDLEPSPDVEVWPKLADEARKRGVAFVQVWIGRKPKSAKSSWIQYWDKDGSMERQLGPSVTPYVYAIEKGVVVSGWQGRVGDAIDEAKAALFRPWAKSKD